MRDCDDRSLRDFLWLLECDPGAVRHVADWRKLANPWIVDRLADMRVLVEVSQAKWHPCEISRDHTCALRVEELLDAPPSQQLIATCPGWRNPPLKLSQRDLFMLTFSRDAFVRELRSAFHVVGPMDFGYNGCREVMRIGELRGRPVFVALMPGLAEFESWLAHCVESYVMVPVWRWLSPSLVSHCAPRGPTELIALSEVLVLKEEGFVAHWPKKDHQAHCVAYTHEGQLTLTEHEYRNFLARAAAFDMVLDKTVVVDGSRYRGLKRNLDGTREEVVLSHSEAAVIVELASTGRALRRGEFLSVSATHVDKIVEHARGLLDIQLTRFKWRAIKLVKGKEKEAKAYQFQPPAGMTWAILAPIAGAMGTGVRAC